VDTQNDQHPKDGGTIRIADGPNTLLAQEELVARRHPLKIVAPPTHSGYVL
jgi:hypothetical protein